MIFNHPIFYEPKDVFYTSIWNPVLGYQYWNTSIIESLW